LKIKFNLHLMKMKIM